MLEIVGETYEIGAVIAGSYRLERIVGEGGMGVVWEASEIATGRRVAVKFLREKRQSDRRNQERVLREARATMAIRHPNVAEVLAVLETDAGVPFLVMELLEGTTLRAHLLRHGTLTLAECASILGPVIAAVRAAHDQRIIHRDLKPENIFLLRQPPLDVRVLDFGIAKQLPAVDATTPEGSAAIPSLTSTGAVLGTPVYMAPEQIFGDDDIDERADIWSLGIILYECLSGRRPTDGEGFGRIIKRITTDPIEPLEHARPELPGDVTKIVDAMLSRDKSSRPPLAMVGEVLARVGGQQASAPPPERKLPAPSNVLLDVAPLSDRDDTTVDSVGRPEARATASTPVAKRRSWLFLTVFGLVGLASAGVAIEKKRSDPARAGAGDDDQKTASTAGSSEQPTSASSGSSADAAVDPTRLFAGVQAAFSHRDGPGCLRELDRYDASAWGVASLGSASPGKGFMSMRGMCTMLAGDCEGGKAIYRKSLLASEWVGFDVLDVDMIEATVDSAASIYCEGDKLSLRDQLLRAGQRLTAAGIGQRPATPAECKEWHATEVRLVPLVQPRNEKDSIYGITSQGLEERAARCFAHAGDCATAFRLFRDNYMKAPLGVQTQAEREAEMRQMYETVATGTSCSGKTSFTH